MSAPKTPGELYDLLHERFGIGTFDETTSKQPFYKARMTEVSKITAMLRKRRVTIGEVAQAADYAHRTRKPITASWQVFDLIPEALRAAKAKAPDQIRERLAEAAAEAMRLGRDDWASRLYRADIHSGPEVLNLWEKTKESL